MVAQEARLIMDADSDIKAVCGLETTGAARNDCAIRNYVQKVQRPNPSGNENCYFDERGRPCYPGGSAGARAPEQKESLRDEIRRKIAAMKEREGRPAEVSDEEVAAVEKQQAGATPEPVAQSTQDWNRDDPLQHYLHGGNRNSGGLNSGALGEAKPGFIGLTPDVAAP